MPHGYGDRRGSTEDIIFDASGKNAGTGWIDCAILLEGLADLG